jgi:hypothetical protein
LLGWGWEAKAEELGGSFELLATLERDRLDGAPELHLVAARPSAVRQDDAPTS